MKPLYLLICITLLSVSVPCYSEQIFNIDMKKVNRIIFVITGEGHHTAIVNKVNMPLVSDLVRPWKWDKYSKYDNKYFEFITDFGDSIVFFTAKTEIKKDTLIEENKKLKEENERLKARILLMELSEGL